MLLSELVIPCCKGLLKMLLCSCSLGCILPVTDRLVTAALVRGSTGLTVRVVAALLVTRLGVVAT